LLLTECQKLREFYHESYSGGYTDHAINQY